MINKQSILDMVKQVTKRSRGKTSVQFMHPRRDWLVGVGLFLIVALVGGVMNARNYVYYNTLDQTITAEAVATPDYRAGRAADAIEIYDARAQQFASFMSMEPVAVSTSSDAIASSTESVIEDTEDTSIETEAAAETTATTSEEVADPTESLVTEPETGIQ